MPQVLVRRHFWTLLQYIGMYFNFIILLTFIEITLVIEPLAHNYLPGF